MIVLAAVTLALLLIPLAALPLICGALAERFWRRYGTRRQM